MKAVDHYLGVSQEILAERGTQYGDFRQLHERIAQRISLVIGQEITAYQAARILVELKLARLDRGWKEDSLVDAIGYMARAGARGSHEGG